MSSMGLTSSTVPGTAAAAVFGLTSCLTSALCLVFSTVGDVGCEESRVWQNS